MAITNGYCTLQDVKDALRVQDSVDDTILELHIETASRQIDDICERVFYSTAGQTRYFVPRDSFVCEIDDLVTLTTLKTSSAADKVYDVTWAAKDYQLEPLNGVVDGLTGHPTTRIRAVDDFLFNVLDGEATVRITGVWGWSAVPTAIKQATVIQAARIFKRNDSPLGIAGFGEMGAVRVGVQLDPDVKHLIDVYRKVRFA